MTALNLIFSFCISQCNHEQARQLHGANLYEHWGKDGQGFFEMLGKVSHTMQMIHSENITA